MKYVNIAFLFDFSKREVVRHFMNLYIKHIIILCLILQSCNYQSNYSKELNNKDKTKIDSLLEIQLQDSNRLTHVRLNFYKSLGGHLYERTIAGVEVEGIDTLVDLEYFNG